MQCLRNYHRYSGQWKTISICESIKTFHYVIHNFQLAKFSRWISFYWRSDGFPLTWSMAHNLKSSLSQENRARQIFRKTIITCAYQGVNSPFCLITEEILGTSLTHFQPMFHFYNPWKYQKTGCFQVVQKWNIGWKLVKTKLLVPGPNIKAYVHNFSEIGNWLGRNLNATLLLWKQLLSQETLCHKDCSLYVTKYLHKKPPVHELPTIPQPYIVVQKVFHLNWHPGERIIQARHIISDMQRI